MTLIGRPELGDDPKYKTNWDRVANAPELDRLIGAWTRTQDAKTAVALMDEKEIPASLIYTIADIAADTHFASRHMVQRVHDPQFGALLHPGIVPQFDGVAAEVAWPGPALGAHTDEVLRNLLGMPANEIERLRREGVVR